jgi:ATP-grasp domain, R2K clade family 3
MKDLTLLISDKPDPERDAVAEVWSESGGEVLRLGRFWDPPAIDPKRARVYGADTFCQVLAQKLGLDLVSPPDDLLLHLPPAVTKRALRGGTLADATTFEFPSFVKSSVPKLIRSRVYRSVNELTAEARGLEPGTALILSEIVEFQVEARAWLLDGQVLSIACYEGARDLTDARALTAAIASEPMMVSPCVLDVGLITDRGWAAIETNAAWGSGLNGCDPRAAAVCIASATRSS